ncbi:MAG: nitroreductase family protein [Chitinivibrionales bacterium]|nr:nitroreductase family protein [Chitinivibrionales bacterium]
MEFYELIENRESIRSYDPNRPVEKSVLMRILNAGRLAPSAANRQPWRFVVVSSVEMIEKMRLCHEKEWFRSAPHILAVVGDSSKSWRRVSDGYNSIETDATIALDHMILAAENEGVGTCWIAAFNPEIARQALRLTPSERIFALTPLGYPQEGFKKKQNKQRKVLEEVVTFL